MIHYTTANTTNDLQQILELQKSNLPISISTDERKAEGFVTVQHDIAILTAMNRPHPHIIAKDGDSVVGYTLVMLRSFDTHIPVLVPMFEQINGIAYKGEHLEAVNYFVMGQVCIQKNYRSKGIFKGLYNALKNQMSPHFKYVITEVSSRNPRSIRAHEKVGFQTILTYQTQLEEWLILLWDWS